MNFLIDLITEIAGELVESILGHILERRKVRKLSRQALIAKHEEMHKKLQDNSNESNSFLIDDLKYPLQTDSISV